MDRLQALYLQLVNPTDLSLPDNITDPSIQETISTRMFNGPNLPPISYQTRVLKMILSRIEESSGPDDVRRLPTVNAQTHALI